MPYIDGVGRLVFEVCNTIPANSAGTLNYQLTSLCLRYLKENGGTNYENINNVVGALECAKLEFYRRLAAPYEDKAVERNGDVY